MSLKEKIISLIDKFGCIGDVNFNYLYEGEAYQSALQFASQYQNIPGVSEQIARLKENNSQYREQFNAIMNDNYENVNQKYHTWYRAYTVKIFSKRLAIISLMVFILLLIIEVFFSSNWSFLLEALMFFIANLANFTLTIGIIGLVIFKIVSGISQKTYDSSHNCLEEQIKSLNAKYLRTVDTNRENIDQLYLGSLDPAHREVVLMRRDQERHHKEMLKQQKQHNEAMLREQERTRNAQEELLRIEQERQDRERRIYG